MNNYSRKFCFGILCPPLMGHLYPMLSLALEIKRRGHRVVLFYYSMNEYLATVAQLGIQMVSVGNEQDKQLLINELEALGKLAGWKANDQTVRIYEIVAQLNLEHLSRKIDATECNALLIDQSLLEGKTIAHISKLPFINICNALMLNPDVELPPFYMGWKFDDTLIGKFRNLIGYLYIILRLGKIRKIIQDYREQNNIPLYPVLFRQGYFSTLVSKIATISQQPEEFDFPRSNLPQNFHFTGPFVDPHSRENVDFPWHKLNGKPVVYSSIGTLQNSNNNIFEKIAAACIDLDCQLVISLGEKNKTTLIRQLPNNVSCCALCTTTNIIKTS